MNKLISIALVLVSVQSASANGHFGDDPYDYIPETIGRYSCAISLGGKHDQWSTLTDLLKYADEGGGLSSYSMFEFFAERATACPEEVNRLLYEDANPDRILKLNCYPTDTSISAVEVAIGSYCRGDGESFECDDQQLLDVIGDPLECALLDYTDVIQNIADRSRK